MHYVFYAAIGTIKSNRLFSDKTDAYKYNPIQLKPIQFSHRNNNFVRNVANLFNFYARLTIISNIFQFHCYAWNCIKNDQFFDDLARK